MMLSHPMHPYAPASHFQPLPSSSGDIDAGMSHHMAMPPTPTNPKNPRHHPYDAPQNSSRISRSSLNGSGAPIRRRISRACDQCNQLRTKCDGKQPCQHCTDFSLKCEYARERKKRGKASRKDIAAAQAAAAAAAAAQQNGGTQAMDQMGLMNGSRRDSELPPPPRPEGIRKASAVSAVSSRSSIGSELHHDLSHQQIHHHQIPQPPQHHSHHLHTPESPSLQLQHEPLPMHYDRMSPYGQQSGGLPPVTTAPNGYVHNEFLMSPHHQAPSMGFPTTQMSSVPGLIAAQSPEDANSAWMQLPSPPQHSFNTGLRYPVLVPLLPHLTSILPAGIACDLLDLYFTNPSTTFFQPASPYVLTHIFRRQSFLHPTNPRPTSPSLLCAMLWVSAQTSDAPYLTATPTARGRVCQKLLELCISLLRPLVHVSFAPTHHHSDGDSGSVGVGLAGLGGGQGGAPVSREGVVGAAGSLDDVLTYAHLGVVISASEFKAASLRWWQAAWTLARELKLNLEVDHDLGEDLDDQRARGQSPGGAPDGRSSMSEEEREERRRTWWLLYIVDRHLALCYNRPISLLDVECAQLYLPYDDNVWQSGEFYGHPESTNIYAQTPVSPTGMPPHLNRHIGPTFEVSGCGLFQFFLPLMTILGEIVDLHHERNRPKFTIRGHENVPPTSDDRFAPFVEEIRAQLECYHRSLEEFEQVASHSRRSGEQDANPERPASEPEIQAKIAISYGTHVMHVLHILLAGKWDPISMLDDNDLWISSSSFVSCTAHAVSAAQAISDILKYDPDLSFMPYFFGIYLLQGSFLLLLIADSLQGDVSEEVVQACETIVRAHEVCVVTLNTEYQRNFRKVMRSALNTVRGRGALEDIDEQKLRRREVLQLYRWCGNGTGLAL